MAGAPTLRPLGGWDIVSRGRFEARHGEHLWTVDLDYFDSRQRLHLYRDGVEVEEQRSPASFQLGSDATIEAATGILGMRRADLVVDSRTTTLVPVDGTAEAWRWKLERDRPELSRLIGTVSWVVLVIALVYEITQLLGLLGLDPPVTLPGAVNLLFGLAALAAAVERALRFKSSRWLG